MTDGDTKLNKYISWTQLFENTDLFKICFCCGNEKYCEFYYNNHQYRVCALCLKKDDIIEFFKKTKQTVQGDKK